MNMHSLTPSISLILAQALIVIALMVKIGIDGTNGAQSQRVFFWAGKTYRGPNRTTQQELDADKARLEAAPDDGPKGPHVPAPAAPAAVARNGRTRIYSARSESARRQVKGFRDWGRSDNCLGLRV